MVVELILFLGNVLCFPGRKAAVAREVKTRYFRTRFDVRNGAESRHDGSEA